jgi:hypothetical protein
VRSSSLPRHLLAIAGHFAKPANDPRPTITPFDRPLADVTPAECYERDETIWVYVAGDWRHGRVIDHDKTTVLVCYYVPGSGDVAVETVAPRCLMHR